MTYAEAVVADSPLNYWQMGETSGTTLAATVGGTAITLGVGGAKPTLGVAGATGALGLACQFDGTDDTANVALNLSGTSKLVVEFWLYWNAFAADDDMAMEFTANGGSTAGGFYLDPNANTGNFGMALGSTGEFMTMTRQSAAAWHHCAVSMDRTLTHGNQFVYFLVDGISQTLTSAGGSASSGAFANSTLNLFNRNSASLFGAGRMQHLALYSALTIAQAQAHYAVRNEVGGSSPYDVARTLDRLPYTGPADRPRILREED